MSPDRTAELWAQTRLAHEGVMLDDAQKVLQLDREAVNGFRRGVLGEAGPVQEDDPMGVRIGDEITHNYPPPAQPAPPQTSPWAKAAIGAAIGLATAGPIGAGLALPSILEAMKPAAVVPAKSDPAVDTDTLFELRLGPPPEPTK